MTHSLIKAIKPCKSGLVRLVEINENGGTLTSGKMSRELADKLLAEFSARRPNSVFVITNEK